MTISDLVGGILPRFPLSMALNVDTKYISPTFHSASTSRQPFTHATRPLPHFHVRPSNASDPPAYHRTLYPIPLKPSYKTPSPKPHKSRTKTTTREQVVSTLDVSQLRNLGSELGVLGTPETIGSYKWVANGDKATIAVPG